MKLDKIRAEYHFYSGKASDLSRQLAFAGIAVVWIFKIDRPGSSPMVPSGLLWPTVILVLSLLLDFLQYLYGGFAYWFLYERKERQKNREHLKDEHDFKVPTSMVRPLDALFVLKLGGIVAAYALLATHLFHQIFY